MRYTASRRHILPLLGVLARRAFNSSHVLADRFVLDVPSQQGVGSVVADIATMLLNAGADPNAADDGEKTPLHYAALGGLESLASALLRQGADPDRREQQHGRTPLHFCATHGHAGTAKLLLDAGADPLVRV